MFEFQSHLIFPTHAVPLAGPLPKGAEILSLDTPDGHKLAGIHIPADQPGPEKILILGFGGNAWNGQDVAEYLHQLFPDAEVAAFHYRGYSPSTGNAAAEALIADAPLVYDWVVQRIAPTKTIAVGFSIGSGVAAALAAKRPLDGLILVTPFDSLKAVAQSMYPWLPIGPFFGHEIDAGTDDRDGSDARRDHCRRPGRDRFSRANRCLAAARAAAGVRPDHRPRRPQ